MDKNRYDFGARRLGWLRDYTLVIEHGEDIYSARHDAFCLRDSVVQDPRVGLIEVHFGGDVYRSSVHDWYEFGDPYLLPGWTPQTMLPISVCDMAQPALF